MADVQYFQYNFTSGAFSPGAQANRNLQQYRHAAANIKNMTLNSTGGLAVRKKFYSFDTEQNNNLGVSNFLTHFGKTAEGIDFMLFLSLGELYEFRLSPVPITYRSRVPGIGAFVSLATRGSLSQVLNTVIICHKDTTPKIYTLGSGGTDGNSNVPNVPDVTISDKPWADDVNPTCGEFYGNRFYFAVADTIYGTSVFQEDEPSDDPNVPAPAFFKFNKTEDRLDDEMVETELSGSGANIIFRIFAESGFFAFTESGWFFTNEQVITPLNFVMRFVSSNVAINTPPVRLQGEMLYLRQNDNDTQAALIDARQPLGLDSSKDFEEENISRLADNFLKSPMDMQVVRGTVQDSGDHLFIKNRDDITLFTLDRFQDIAAFMSWSVDFGDNISAIDGRVAVADNFFNNIYVYDTPDNSDGEEADFDWEVETLAPDFSELQLNVALRSFRLKKAFIRLRDAVGVLNVEGQEVNTHRLDEDPDVPISRVVEVYLNRGFETPNFNSVEDLPRGIKITGTSASSMIIENITIEVEIRGQSLSRVGA